MLGVTLEQSTRGISHPPSNPHGSERAHCQQAGETGSSPSSSLRGFNREATRTSRPRGKEGARGKTQGSGRGKWEECAVIGPGSRSTGLGLVSGGIALAKLAYLVFPTLGNVDAGRPGRGPRKTGDACSTRPAVFPPPPYLSRGFLPRPPVGGGNIRGPSPPWLARGDMTSDRPGSLGGLTDRRPDR